MKTIRRAEVPAEALQGRALQRIVGRGASIASERMTVGAVRYADELGAFEPHHHAEETILVLAADRLWARWGPARDDLPNRVDLEAGMVLHTPAWEWHTFEWEPGGGGEALVIYGQVDDIRPEDAGRTA